MNEFDNANPLTAGSYYVPKEKLQGRTSPALNLIKFAIRTFKHVTLSPMSFKTTMRFCGSNEEIC